MAFLKVYTNGEERTVFLGDAPVVIGRAQDADVMIKDVKASRRHCVIEPEPGGWRVRDLGSGNGTKLNGARVDREALRPDDVVTIGDVRILYAGEAAAVVAATAPRAEPARPAAREPRRTRASATSSSSSSKVLIAGVGLLAAAAILFVFW
ncbi:MAG: FHA domain-containing protein, partial [Planctomycetota bacterium]|nr:FHA domain-containing protein [Planctomycetota bacterium]